MMIPDVIVAGTGASVPGGIITNADLEALVDTDDEWIRTRTGIRERRRLGADEGVADIGAKAARSALTDAGIDAREIDLIIGATFTHDLAFPPMACLVQRDIGADKAAAFDVNAVCAGYLFALVQAAQFLKTGVYRTALIVAAEGLTRYVDYSDRNSCILFGDGASAIVLQSAKPEGRGLLDFDLGTDGTRAAVAHCPYPAAPAAWLRKLSDDREEITPYLWQDGKAMFKAAVNGMTDSVRRILERQKLGADDIRVLVPHQANLRIIEAVGERIGLPPERVALCIEEYGNTSAASMGIAFDKWRRNESPAHGDAAMFTAFAGGLAWGSALVRL